MEEVGGAKLGGGRQWEAWRGKVDEAANTSRWGSRAAAPISEAWQRGCSSDDGQLTQHDEADWITRMGRFLLRLVVFRVQ